MAASTSPISLDADLRPWFRGDVLLATAAVNVLGLALPLTVLHIYDRVLSGGSRATLTFLVVMVVGALALEWCLRSLRSQVMAALASRFEHRLSLRVFAALVQNRQRDHGLDSAAVLQRCRDVTLLREFYFGLPMLTALDLPFAAVALGVVAHMTGLLTAIPVIIVLIIVVFITVLSRSLGEKAMLQQRTDTARVRFVYEILRGLHTVKALALESQLRRRHENLQAASASSAEAVTNLNGFGQSVTSSIASSATALVVVVGAGVAVAGDITIGVLAATSMLAGRMVTPIARAASSWSRYHVVHCAERDLRDLIASPPSGPAPAAAVHDVVVTGHLALLGADVAHPETPSLLLRGVTFMAPACSMTAIVGASGSGKSVLLEVLAGERPLAAGDLVIDDVAVTPDRVAGYRRQACLITGNKGLFSGTILQNVTMLRETELRAAAVRAIQDVGLDRFVAKLPDGLDTSFEGGDAGPFPPGVTQRLLIARALVNQPRVILFDGSNDGLDFESDQIVLTLLQRLKARATIILVSERPSYLRSCDAHYRIQDHALTRISVDAAIPDLSQDHGPARRLWGGQ